MSTLSELHLYVDIYYINAVYELIQQRLTLTVIFLTVTALASDR
jgi:hypothetical protein